MGTEIIDVDLRQVPTWDRHARIFREWDALEPGNTLRIHNDYDPIVSRYRFETGYEGHFEWQYEKQGPKDWIVSIKKV